MKKYLLFILLLIGFSPLTFSQIKETFEFYNLNNHLESRSISFENPTGEPGNGGKAASEIGIGRKGAPNKIIKSNEEVILCDIQKSGTIRHIWMTGEWFDSDWVKKAEGRKKLLRSTYYTCLLGWTKASKH